MNRFCYILNKIFHSCFFNWLFFNFCFLINFRWFFIWNRFFLIFLFRNRFFFALSFIKGFWFWSLLFFVFRRILFERSFHWRFLLWRRFFFWRRFFLFGSRFLLWWFFFGLWFLFWSGFFFRFWFLFWCGFFLWNWFFLRWDRFFFGFRWNRSKLFIWTSYNNIIRMLTSFCTTLMAFMKLTFSSCALYLRCINRGAFLNIIRTPFRFISRWIFGRYREWWKLIAFI